jgi:hypothetical protein
MRPVMWRSVAIGIVLGGVLAGCSSGSASSRPESGRTAKASTVVLLPPYQPPVAVHRVRVGHGPYDLASGFGAVWVSTTEGVVQLSVTSGSVAGRVAIPSDSEWSNVATGAGSVWFLGHEASAWRVWRVNPATLNVAATLPLRADPGAVYEGLVVTGQFVCTQRLSMRPATVCIPVTGGKERVFGHPPGSAPMATSGGDVWVGGTTVTRIDPATGHVVTPATPSASGIIDLAADRSDVWAVAARRRAPPQLWLLRSNRVVRRITLNADLLGRITVLHGHVWMLSHSARKAVVSFVTPAGSLVRLTHLTADPPVLATGGGIWAARYATGSVFRIGRP